MAGTSSRAHLFNQLSRRATTSPREDEYVTAVSNSTYSDQSFEPPLHSTGPIHDISTQQPLPQQYQQRFNYEQYPDDVSEGGSDGSADMSIELGRGVKRGARNADEEVSSNHVFNMGNDSLYELTGTPPVRSRNTSQKKTDDGLRRQASIRRATETAKGNDKRATGLKHRSLSEALRQIGTENESSFTAEDAAQHTATFNARNTRFSRSRQTSANEVAHQSRLAAGPSQQTPRKGTNTNGTIQSNSFMLPDLPDITELVSGVRKDGTPVFNRNAKSKSRFTSGSYKQATRQEHYQIENVPVPEEEKAIYASLQLLKDRVDQLEMERSEAAKRAEEYEGEIIDLRSQLGVAQRRPDSGIGSSDEDGAGGDKSRTEKKRLQASVKALQDRLDRSERKISVSEIAVKRVTKERDELITQIGVAYYNNEELKAEKETFQDQHGKMASEHEELKEEVDALRKENQALRILMEQTQRSYDEETLQRNRKDAQLRSNSERKAQTTREIEDATRQVLQARSGASRKQDAKEQSNESAKRRLSLGFFDEATSDDLAVRIAQEVKKNREEATTASKTQNTRHARSNSQHQTNATRRSISKSKGQDATAGSQRPASAPKRTFPAPTAEPEASDAESTTQLDFTRNSRNAAKRASLPTPARPVPTVAREEDSRDLTYLSLQDANEINNLRKKIEDERRAGRMGGRAASAPEGTQQLSQQLSQGMPRKSSMKDIAAGSEAGTGRFNIDELTKNGKSVRVQSPHTTEDSTTGHQQQTETADVSFTSNTSRRRRRAASAENMTSAFILPDITLHGKAQPQHTKDNCTACPPPTKDITIPTPIPVTSRPEDVADVTNATLRPAQPPKEALATVIKQLQDELTHLKLQLAAQHRLYTHHDPALSKRRRQDVRATMDRLTREIERRSDQVYALFDVVEGQKDSDEGMDEGGVEETLESLGIDPVELGRGAPEIGVEDLSVEEELPWEGLSEVGSEAL